MLRSKAQWFVGILLCVLLTGYFHQGENINGVIWSDQEGYYIYLPAFFIDGFDNNKCVNGCFEVETKQGKRLFTKYTYGIALLESPFFLAAHLFTKLGSYPSDGRSLPYIWGVMIAAIFYLLAGLFLVSKTLAQLRFSWRIQWSVPLLLLLGTNLFYYTFREAGMSHVYTFSLVAGLVYSSHRKSISNETLWSISTAFLLALIILIRPTNAILIWVIILWNAKPAEFFTRVKEFLLDTRWMLCFALALVLLFIPQLLYWKAITGHYIFYSYGEESFIYWNNPKVLQVLFSHTNGWLIYSPFMLAAVFGIGIMIARKTTGWFMPIVVLSMATYVFGSWWAWWFGGAYGHRCYVDYLAVLSVPLAITLNWVMERKNLVRFGFLVLALLAIYVNLRMSYMYHGLWDGPDWNWGSYIGKLKEAFYVN